MWRVCWALRTLAWRSASAGGDTEGYAFDGFIKIRQAGTDAFNKTDASFIKADTFLKTSATLPVLRSIAQG